MKNNSLISVIVPVYNDERFLKSCIDSIINQSYSKLEIILVDDGSTDNSPKILDEFSAKDSRIKVYHKKNTGVSDTRNYGIERATGEYICFSDADDILTKDYVKYLYSLILKYKAQISLSLKMFGTFDREQVKKVIENVISGENAAEKILTYNIPIGVYSKLFNAKFLKLQNIQFDTDLFIGEGFNYNFDAFMKAQKVAISNKKIYFYRRDNNASATTKFSMKKWNNGLFAIRKIRDKIGSHSSSNLLKAWKFAWWRTNSDVYDVMVLAKAKYKYPKIFKERKIIIKKLAYTAWRVPVSKQNRMRATIMMFFPNVIPFLMKVRDRKYNVKRDN